VCHCDIINVYFFGEVVLFCVSDRRDNIGLHLRCVSAERGMECVLERAEIRYRRIRVAIKTSFYAGFMLIAHVSIRDMI
jgi:hypothetical protein